MKKKWSGVLLVATCFLLSSQVLAVSRWHINLGAGGGLYNLPWGKINEFNQAFESFTQDMGIEDFKIGKLKDNSPVLSLSYRLEVSSKWEIGLHLSGLLGGFISESEEKSTPLPGGGERWINAGYNLFAGMAFGNLIGYYKFNPGKRLSPYMGAGVGGYFVNLKGDYSYSEQTFTPPWDYQSRYLQESFLLSDTVIGYTLAAGCDWMVLKWHFDIRIGVKAAYHWLPEITGQFDYVGIEGFDSYPVEPVPFGINPSGLQYGVYVFVRF